MALDAADLPQLTSADLELLFKDPPAGGPYSLLDETAAWIMEPSPAGSGVPDPATGMAGPAADWLPELPIGLDGTQLPRAGMLPDLFVDPLLGSQTGLQLPLPVHPADAFMPPLHADSSGAGASGSGDSQSPSHGNSAPAASIPASAVTAMTSGQQRKAGGGGGKAKELTEEQKERIKAKNRRAQSRYREKQKAKAAAAEKEFADTAKELERMRLENAQLQERQSAMQQVLTVREDFMQALETGKAASENDVPALPNGQPSSTAVQAAAPLAARCGMEDTNGPACPLTGLTLSQIAELKRSPPEALQREWKSIAQRLTALLQQHEAAQASADGTLAVRAEQVGRQIEDVLKEGQSFCFEHAVYQPTNVQKLFAAALDDGRSTLSTDDLSHWVAAADALDISDSQLERLAVTRAQFIRSIGEVCAERRAIFSRLAAVEVPDPAGGLRAMQHATAAWLQKAVAIVKSWPLFPDMCSISTVALQKRRPELLSADAKLPELAAAGNCPKLLTAGEAAPTASA
ncbi:hypothetical protein COHA_007449 [Chlorella ohadii]|uniref:BZIP domain-containing protein n=1 Tax=Chlorella ohadii TaxID=2649997 RepID=A0AAD5H3I0_9CHLO|nr:hypothetical protein COHA_007449 [Chlorella ohadii]